MTSHLSGVWYRVTPLEVTSGQGCWVTDVDGRRYLDLAAGIAVNSTGHSHPRVVQAIADQAARFVHAQVNVFRHDLLEPTAAKLAEITPPSIDTFFFSNSGAEILEASVKLAKHATGRPHVIVLDGGFHGRTHLTMAMSTFKAGYRAGYSPLPAGVFVAPFPDPLAEDVDHEVARALRGLDRLFATMTKPDETAAIVVEPVVGEGGYIPLPPAFLHGVAERCRRHGILLVADEVQSGFGRTGRMFAIEHHGIEPDVICMAKGIASGFPFSALGTRRELDERWVTGSHGGTYGGNPMGCAAAIATIEILQSPGFLDHVQARSRQLFSGLRDLQAEHDAIVQVRGIGLMIGVQFDRADRLAAVRQHLLDEGRVITMDAGTDSATLRLMPPLVIDEAEASLALGALSAALKVTA